MSIEGPDQQSGDEIWAQVTRGGVITLGVGAPDCGVCDRLYATMTNLWRQGGGVGTFIWHTADFESSTSIFLLKNLSLSDFPTVYVFSEGQLQGGVVGFNNDGMSPEEATASLGQELRACLS